MFSELVIMMGVITVAYSFYESVKFFRTRTQLGIAVGVVIATLCLCMALTSTFAVISHAQILVTLEGYVQSFLRFLMFGSSLVAVRYIDIVVTSIAKKDES